MTKLTLRLDEDLIVRAKQYARRTGKTLSQVVADYFRLLTAYEPEAKGETPIVQSLKGSLRGADVDRNDYRRHLREKYTS